MAFVRARARRRLPCCRRAPRASTIQVRHVPGAPVQEGRAAREGRGAQARLAAPDPDRRRRHRDQRADRDHRRHGAARDRPRRQPPHDRRPDGRRSVTRRGWCWFCCCCWIARGVVVNCGLARRSRSSCSSSSCVSTGHDLVDPGGIYLIAVQERITTQQQYFEEWATLQDELKIEAEARLAEKRRAAGATDEDDLTDGRGVDGEEEEEGEPRHAAVAWTPFLQQLDEATQRSSPPSPRSALGPSRRQAAAAATATPPPRRRRRRSAIDAQSGRRVKTGSGLATTRRSTPRSTSPTPRPPCHGRRRPRRRRRRRARRRRLLRPPSRPSALR